MDTTKFIFSTYSIILFQMCNFNFRSEESESDTAVARLAEREPHVGRVVLVESGGAAERRRAQPPAFPALVVAPTAQIKVKEDYLVRSFKDGR